MHLLIDIKSEKDKKLFVELASRFNLKSAEVDVENFEDIAIGNAIKKGLRSARVDENNFLKTLAKRINDK